MGDGMTTSELYTPAWHEWHKWTNDWSTRALFGVFAHLGVPKRMLDVGCADGHLVKIAANLCTYAEGYDIAAVEQHRHNYDIGQYDLTRPLTTVNPFDLVISWEVAEHLPADSAETFCNTLAAALEAGGHLVFTAAIPGQGGHGHINEQPHAYWREKLEARGLTYQGEVTEALSATWNAACTKTWWYGQNCMVFRR